MDNEKEKDQAGRKHLKIRYLDPQRSKDGNSEIRSSEATYSKHEKFDKARNSKEGRAEDQEARGTIFRDTGWDAGHKHGLAHGVEPTDKQNISPQNALQNRAGGTWNNKDIRFRRELKADLKGEVKETIHERYSPNRKGYGSEVPISRQAILQKSDGTKINENAHYGNFSTTASRRADELKAQGKQPQPGEMGALHDKQRLDLRGHRKAHLTPEGSAGQEEWSQLKRTPKQKAAMTPEQRSDLRDKMRQREVNTGKSQAKDK